MSNDGRVRWGILATGGIAAAFTADLVDLPDAEVVAVASRSEDSAKAFAERFGIPRAYGDWRALAEDADVDVDVVYVATPHAAHRVAAGMCLEAGRNVLCEKAFTLNAREAEELVALARERGRFLMEAMWMYCNPLVRRLAELVRDGAIGEVRTVQADFGLAGPFPPSHRLRDPAQGGARCSTSVCTRCRSRSCCSGSRRTSRGERCSPTRASISRPEHCSRGRAVLSLRCTAPSWAARARPPR